MQFNQGHLLLLSRHLRKAGKAECPLVCLQQPSPIIPAKIACLAGKVAERSVLPDPSRMTLFPNMLSAHKQRAAARNQGGVRGRREGSETVVSQILYSPRVLSTCIFKISCFSFHSSLEIRSIAAFSKQTINREFETNYLKPAQTEASPTFIIIRSIHFR